MNPLLKAKTMLAELNDAEKRKELRINRRKTHFMKKDYSEGVGKTGRNSTAELSTHLFVVLRTLPMFG